MERETYIRAELEVIAFLTKDDVLTTTLERDEDEGEMP